MKYDAAFLTVQTNIKPSKIELLEGMSNVFAGGKNCAQKKESYDVVNAVADGRKAVMAIHKTITTD
ncbi:hypothetical protein EU527_18645 [Candidatus Thorarchaeota archaeon]|nr:MAG: hypothetical protein EU527_18645 [Candidatus Thorarchaeota archaeon]